MLAAAAWVPHAITGLRALSAPLLWWLLTSLQLETAFVCLALAVLSDAIDGPVIRRIGTPSTAGGYFDATADCAVILAAFSGFASIGIYPGWTVALIAVVFVVFIATSQLMPVIYDPVGRQIGGLLFLCIGATLLLPDFFYQAVILSIVTGALLITLTARLLHTFRMVRPGTAAPLQVVSQTSVTGSGPYVAP